MHLQFTKKISSDSMAEDPSLYICRWFKKLSPSITSKILRKCLVLHPNKIQLVEKLIPQDHNKSRLFVE